MQGLTLSGELEGETCRFASKEDENENFGQKTWRRGRKEREY
jgi:hypothetical protein